MRLLKEDVKKIPRSVNEEYECLLRIHLKDLLCHSLIDKDGNQALVTVF